MACTFTGLTTVEFVKMAQMTDEEMKAQARKWQSWGVTLGWLTRGLGS